MPFQCSICDEPSTRICVRCTKDACDNHICGKCLKCSDCCECEVALDATPRIALTVHTPPAPELEVGAEAVAEGEAVAETEEAEEAAPLLSEVPEPDPAALAGPHTLDPPAQDALALPVPEGE
jgi:hypothetical protein